MECLTTVHRITLLQGDKQIVVTFAIASKDNDDYHRQYNKVMQQYKYCRIIHSEYYFC
jgi:hypothetical protein